jgi:Xaa-Pro dipeptidase
MSKRPFIVRQKKLSTALSEHRIPMLALNPGPTLSYLTGLHFHLSERPILFIYSSDSTPHIVLPELEKGKLANLDFDLRAHTYSEDPTTWDRAFRNIAAEVRLDSRRVAIEPRRLRVLELRLLENAAPRSAYVNGESMISAIRMIKDADEISSMRKAVRVAQTGIEETRRQIESGITETEAASELVLQLLRAGSDSELPFAPIVAFGKHSADPHAVPGKRKLTPGDLVLFDWGAAVDGYVSDITRMFSFGEIDEELVRITEIVERANQAAFEATHPDVSASVVDAAARSIIDDAGFGSYFIHRTGHGLGLEAHEEPYIRSGNGQHLLPGMVFTIEPGIYIPDLGGARIEDDVVVTADGAERLTDLPRKLVQLGP